jgi:hypothetical protein
MDRPLNRQPREQIDHQTDPVSAELSTPDATCYYAAGRDATGQTAEPTTEPISRSSRVNRRHRVSDRVLARRAQLRLDQDQKNQAVRRSAQQSWALLCRVAWVFRRYPPIALLVIWAMLVGIAIAAIATLVNLDASIDFGTVGSSAGSSVPQPSIPQLPVPQSPVPQSPVPAPVQNGLETAAPQPQQLQPQRTVKSNPPRPSSHSPAAAVGAIFLSCGAGCLLLSKWLLAPQSRTQTRTRSARLDLQGDLQGNRLEAASQSAASLRTSLGTSLGTETSMRLQPSPPAFFDIEPAEPHPAPLVTGMLEALPEDEEYAEMEPIEPMAALEPVQAIILEAEPEAAAKSEIEEATATVVSDQQDHPLDWIEPSLADVLDLRRRRSVSFWL